MYNSTAWDLHSHSCARYSTPPCRDFFKNRLLPSILFLQPHQLLPQLKGATLPRRLTPSSTHPAFTNYIYEFPLTSQHSSFFQPKCPHLWQHNKEGTSVSGPFTHSFPLSNPMSIPQLPSTHLNPSLISTSKAYLPLQKRHSLQRHYTNT